MALSYVWTSPNGNWWALLRTAHKPVATGSTYTYVCVTAKTMSLESQDALYAQLLGMGFEPEMIEECQVAMAQSTTPFSMQAATEW